MENKKNAKNKILISILTVVVIALSFFSGYFIKYLTMDKEERAVYDLINKYKKYYLFDDGDLVKDISDAILDDYSAYYTKEEYEEIKRQKEGNSYGIGLSISASDMKILKVLGNSPCEKAGVMVGGKIIGVKSGEKFETVYNYDDFTYILNAINDGVEFTIKIDYGYEYLDFVIKKQAYKQTYVRYYDNLGCYAFNDDINGDIKFTKIKEKNYFDNASVGMIVYNSFYGLGDDITSSNAQIVKALEFFKESGKKNLILDLRNNGGGYMDVMCEVSSHFIDIGNGNKKDVSIALDKNKEQKTYKSGKCDYDNYGFENIIILANEKTASASEALIGAILDYDKKNIVKVLVASSIYKGQVVYKTFGKGIMQSTYVNVDGSAVKLTTAKIFWPVSQISIHEEGIIGLKEGKILGVDSEKTLSTALELLS